MQNKITTNEYCDTGYKNLIFFPEQKKYPILKKIYKHFKKNNGHHKILEIGCFPGRFLHNFGKLGYELNGYGQTQYLSNMVNWFKLNNFKIGNFIQTDILVTNREPRYNIVFSSGFIEHFNNFEYMLEKHIKLVKEKGFIFITTPNFSGFIQKTLHKLLDKDNFDKHYIPSMNVDIWKNILIRNNFNIIDYGYIGGFDFWVGPEKRNIFKKIIIKIIRLFTLINIYPNNKEYSPEIFIIAQKI